MNCANCLKAGPVIGNPMNAMRTFWVGLTRAWRVALVKLAQLG
jgi:hypothetical protein